MDQVRDVSAATQKQALNALMAKLLYGCGLRFINCIRLRVQDVDLLHLQQIWRRLMLSGNWVAGIARFGMLVAE